MKEYKKRLNDAKAEFLGLDLKPQTLHGNAKYCLDKNQYEKLKFFKVEKSKTDLDWRRLSAGGFEVILEDILENEKKSSKTNGILDKSNVLVIGDLHEPFCLDGYLEFCQDTYKKYNCNKVVFIGDVIDNHYSSYHETDSDALGGGDELTLAVNKLSRWYKAFPVADVMLGNHDLIIARKAQSGAIPKKWIKTYKEVLETPKWNFVDEIVIDDVLYHHGIGSKAHVKAVKNMVSTVGGHHHTDFYVMWYVGKTRRIFGMQVGCGIDIKSYAMAYGKWFPKPAIGCGVVLEGDVAIPILMDLK
ncbi:MAG: metallophosphoesterase [Flavobacteriales bacterium]|nr:metallophosphoesterase [Flavobacteriales bacterium]